MKRICISSDGQPFDNDLGDMTPSERVDSLFVEYERRTDSTITRPVNSATRKRVALWFKENWDRYVLYKSEPVPRWIAHADLAEKGSHMTQARCMVCEARGGSHHFPIDVDPWSQQSIENRANLVTAVRNSIGTSENHQLATGPLCVSVTCNIAAKPGAKRMDVDNLVKGLLDSMNGIVYADDSQIQCLTVRRLETASVKGFYHVRVTEVYPYSEDCIWDSATNPRILWGERVDRSQ